MPDAFVREVELVQTESGAVAGRAEGRYKKGKREGMWVGFWPDGTRHWAATYVAGNRHMLFMAWRQSGTLAVEEMYKHGKLHGVSKVYAEDGRTLVSERRFQDGAEKPRVVD